MVTYDSTWLDEGDTLVCFGDSITASPNGYVKILAGKLQHRGIKVINAGRGGDKTPWALTRLQSEVIGKKPAAVSIFLGTNDAVVGRGRWADEPTISPEAYRCNLIWIVHLCKLAGIAKFSITPPLYRFEGAVWEEHGEIMIPYRQAARDAAAATMARFVPADIAFAAEWQKHQGHSGLLLTSDGTHLTDKGNQLVAESMLKTWFE